MRVQSKETGEISHAHVIHRIFTLPNQSAYIEFAFLSVDEANNPIKSVEIPQDQWMHMEALYEPSVGDYIICADGGNYYIASPQKFKDFYNPIEEKEEK